MLHLILKSSTIIHLIVSRDGAFKNAERCVIIRFLNTMSYDVEIK